MRKNSELLLKEAFQQLVTQDNLYATASNSVYVGNLFHEKNSDHCARGRVGKREGYEEKNLAPD